MSEAAAGVPAGIASGQHRLGIAREGTAVPAAAGRDSGNSVHSEGEPTPKASPSTAFCGNRPWLYALLIK